MKIGLEMLELVHGRLESELEMLDGCLGVLPGSLLDVESDEGLVAGPDGGGGLVPKQASDVLNDAEDVSIEFLSGHGRLGAGGRRHGARLSPPKSDDLALQSRNGGLDGLDRRGSVGRRCRPVGRSGRQGDRGRDGATEGWVDA